MPAYTSVELDGRVPLPSGTDKESPIFDEYMHDQFEKLLSNKLRCCCCYCLWDYDASKKNTFLPSDKMDSIRLEWVSWVTFYYMRLRVICGTCKHTGYIGVNVLDDGPWILQTGTIK